MTRRSIYRVRRIIAVLVLAAGLIWAIINNPDSYDFASSPFGELVDDPAEIALKETQTESESTKAVDVLESLAVKEKNTSEKYYRKLFYDSWGMTSSGCNIREAILTRDLSNIQLKGCKVQSGTLEDPYTGKEINFIRGQGTSEAVQIDHVVALSNAWSTGAYAFDSEKRYEISQDPLNLIAVDGPANQEKSDGDAATWLPSNGKFRCQYVARQISVKYKYHLWVTPAEKLAMQKVLSACPDEPTIGLEKDITAQ